MTSNVIPIHHQQQKTPLSARQVASMLINRTPKPAINALCPFRRSHSKPEDPTSNMGAKAMEEACRDNAKRNGKKLIFLRNFSVSEEDVVICNRVRCGIDPMWFQHRKDRDRRYLRSLSVEEMRLTATRKRTNAVSIGKVSVATPHAVKENEPFEEPVVRSPRPVTSPRNQATASKAKKDIETQGYGADEATRLTRREKAMHGRYLIRESFANGSYGQVCAGEDNKSHKEVAVKIVPKYILISPEEKQSVIREQIIHRGLDHPHIIKLIDVFEDEGAHYFILERADSGSLSSIISYSGLDEARCREIFRQVLQALDYLHRNHIIHHDIKPHNVLLHKGNTIKLCDFGASRALNSDQTSLPFAGIFGTPGYIAPELLMGDKVYGPAIDTFSAGVMLFEMVFGYPPFYPPSSCTYAPLEFPPRSNASIEVKHLLTKLLQRDPTQRITPSQALRHPWIAFRSSGRSAPSSPVTSPKTKATTIFVDT